MLTSRRGQATLEYILVLSLIVVPMAYAMRGLLQILVDLFSRIAYQMASPGL